MIHEYGRDPVLLAAALNKGHEAVPMLVAAAQAMAAMVTSPPCFGSTESTEARRRGLQHVDARQALHAAVKSDELIAAGSARLDRQQAVGEVRRAVLVEVRGARHRGG